MEKHFGKASYLHVSMKPTKSFYIGKTVSGGWFRILTPFFMLDISIGDF